MSMSPTTRASWCPRKSNVIHDDVISSTRNDNEPPLLLQTMDDTSGLAKDDGDKEVKILPCTPEKPAFPAAGGLWVIGITSHPQEEGQLETGKDFESKAKASQQPNWEAIT